MIVAPEYNLQFVPGEPEKKALENKKKLLAGHDAQVLMKQQAKTEEIQKPGYIETMIQNVIDNIKITVERIHVRYEQSSGGNCVAMGLMLPSLTLDSCDTDWVPKLVHQGEITYKVGRLTNLSVYIQPHAKPFAGLDKKAILEAMATTARTLTPADYLIEPISLEVGSLLTLGSRSPQQIQVK